MMFPLLIWVMAANMVILIKDNNTEVILNTYYFRNFIKLKKFNF